MNILKKIGFRSNWKIVLVLLICSVGVFGLSVFPGKTFISMKGEASGIQVDLRSLSGNRNWKVTGAYLCVGASSALLQPLKSVVGEKSSNYSGLDLTNSDMVSQAFTNNELIASGRNVCASSRLKGIEISKEAYLAFDSIKFSPATIEKTRDDWIDVFFSHTKLEDILHGTGQNCKDDVLQDNAYRPVLIWPQSATRVELPASFKLIFPVSRGFTLPVYGKARVGSLVDFRRGGLLLSGTAYLHTEAPLGLGQEALYLTKKSDLVLGDVANFADKEGCLTVSEGMISVLDTSKFGFDFYLGGGSKSKQILINRASESGLSVFSIKTNFLDIFSTHPLVPAAGALFTFLIFILQIDYDSYLSKRDDIKVRIEKYRRRPFRTRRKKRKSKFRK
nr:hypothetical protein [uncultured Cohaesibacter sp.]